ncbi:uncharacterized protein LOC106130440 isoform X2 [Amyelois transitella]|uniref:uncharacterized protein LOC106130440 isoform X2 n=1 Tax=Amyelois transitella TaxID=680683 RepID=UPI00298FB399|nr:uncharacterized protein LOC106130440 isoform X2 [Amyelois transitella]
MDGDEFSEFLIPKTGGNDSTSGGEDINDEEETNVTITGVCNLKREPLTTKKAVKFLLEGTLKYKVCRYCMNVDSPLYEMDQVFQIASQGALYKVTIRDMVASFYPFQVLADPNFPTKICNQCLENTIQSYLFTQQCERSGRALRNCFEDMYEKLDKLDPLERTKKRGRQKLNPNYNKLHSEHENVIDYADPVINIVNIGSELTENIDNKINELECPKCWLRFESLESRLYHEKIHPKSMWFNCRICGKSFAKRHVYRKHVKSAHEPSKSKTLIDTDYKCSECDVGSETYDQHLQHIEKHKFHMVMEHLIESKMDELCTVCLSKGVSMVKLDRTINFHGGCPELTGHRSLYTILGSTMPERSSYKYRELLVPYEANVLTLTKKVYQLNGDKSCFAMKKAKYHKFSLSDPVVISRETYFIIDNYIFFFDNPIHIEQILSPKNDSEEEIVNQSEVCSLQTNMQVKNKMVENLATIDNMKEATECFINGSITTDKQCSFTFSNPEYITNVVEIQIPISNHTTSDCTTDLNSKVDWIFGKCKVQTINGDGKLKADFTNKNNKIEVPIVQECQYCWIFKCTDKCHYCQKSNNGNSNSKIKLNTTSDVSEYSKLMLTNKRKSVDSFVLGSKRSKWQCKYCLTDNGNNEKCYCCDSDHHVGNTDHIKLNLGINRSFFETDAANKSPTAINEENALKDIEMEPLIQEGTKIKFANFEETNQDISDITKNIAMEPVSANTHFEQYPIASHDTHIIQEEMDVEECNLQNELLINQAIDSQKTTSVIELPIPFMQVSNNPLCFNIGAGSSDYERKKSRRFKRPIRRMATSFHK